MTPQEKRAYNRGLEAAAKTVDKYCEYAEVCGYIAYQIRAKKKKVKK